MFNKDELFVKQSENTVFLTWHERSTPFTLVTIPIPAFWKKLVTMVKKNIYILNKKLWEKAINHWICIIYTVQHKCYLSVTVWVSAVEMSGVCADDLWLLLAPAGLRDVVEGMDYHGDEVCCCCPPRWSVLGLEAEQELALADLSQYGSLWRNVEKLLTAIMRETSAPRMTQNSHRFRVQLQWGKHFKNNYIYLINWNIRQNNRQNK